MLLETPDGRSLRAVDVTTGERLWRRAAPGRVLLSLGGGLVTLSERGMLRGLDAAAPASQGRGVAPGA